MIPADPPGLGLEPVVHTGLARGRALFNRGEYWAAHEALETAWNAAKEPDKPLLQGIIQAAAAFHKLVVQDNAAGAVRLLDRAIERVEDYGAGAAGLSNTEFVEQLKMWRRRVAASPAPVVFLGLPRLDWSRAESARLLRLDAIEAWRLPTPEPGAVVVSVEAEGLSGWGECRMAWERRGVWSTLVEALAPALLTEAVAAPSELPVVWSDVVRAGSAAAGLEAAIWDLYAQRRGISLVEALGASPGATEVACRVTGAGGSPELLPERICEGVAAAAQAGFRLVIVPLRPHYDRRLAATVVNCGTAVAFDLGGHYRRADSDALRAVARLGPRYMAAPFPDGDVVQSARLRRDLEAPLAVGGLMTAEAVESGHMIDAYDIVGVDPGRTGLTEAVRIADYLHERSVPTLVRSSARLELGARADLAFARHPAASLPVEMGACLGDDGRPWPPRPSLEVGGGPGVGVRPGREALTAAAEVHVRLEA